MAEDVAKIVELLSGNLAKQRTAIKKYQDYYDGKQPLSYATSDYDDAFALMLRELNDNWMPIIVDAVAERMKIEGFRFADGKGDKDAQIIWQRNSLDADSDLHATESLISGVGYVMVWNAFENGSDLASITVEDPTQVYVHVDPGNRRNRLYAIKEWTDDWGIEFRNVYFPDRIEKSMKEKGKWSDLPKVGNPLGKVPIVPFYNRPKLRGGTFRSELLEAISTQDQINKILADAIVASEFGAYRQRWATGVDVERDENGKPVQPFKAGHNRVWIGPDSDAKFGTFEVTDLRNYVQFIENRIQSLASRTRTPPHYLLGGAGTFPSGESLKSTETGLIAKVKNRMRRFGESWEETMRLAFLVEGNEAKGNFFAAETIWADPESRTEAEHVDALVKLRSLKVPIRKLWEDAGYSQEEIERMVAWAREEALNDYLANGSAPAPVESGSVDDVEDGPEDVGNV